MKGFRVLFNMSFESDIMSICLNIGGVSFDFSIEVKCLPNLSFAKLLFFSLQLISNFLEIL